jgi:hypothetical protein
MSGFYWTRHHLLTPSVRHRPADLDGVQRLSPDRARRRHQQLLGDDRPPVVVKLSSD